MEKSLEPKLHRQIANLVMRYPILRGCEEEIAKGYTLLEQCYESKHKVLIAGNGGSAADAEHLAGELMKKFRIQRSVKPKFAEKLNQVDAVRGKYLAKHLEQALTAIPLVAHEALTTAYINDVDALGVFAQQLYGYGQEGDIFLGISTSGNAKNIMYAAVTAKAMGLKVLGLSGADGGELAQLADVIVRVPETETYRIQELHLPVYHCWCMMLEEHFFGEETGA